MRDQNQALQDEKQQKEDTIDSHKNQNAQLVQQKQRLQGSCLRLLQFLCCIDLFFERLF